MLFFDEMLKKFISESFFNPILHILPIIVFIVIDDFWGDFTAWIVASTIAVVISSYVFVFYRSLFRWILISTSVFIFVGLTVTYFRYSNYFISYRYISGEVIALFFLMILIFFKRKIEKMVNKISSGKISMKNNLNELIRINFIFSLILSLFIFSNIWINKSGIFKREEILSFIYQLYASLMILAVIYEFIRVFAIRGKLLKEDWLPIVNSSGREIGSINYQTSMWNEENKFIHPVVRVIVLDDNKLFLQQHNSRSGLYASKWDNALSGHLKFGEKIPECIKRISGDVYGSEIHNPIFLGNYQIENPCEFQYVHLFLSCKIADVQPNQAMLDRVKWWTITQIIENLSAGIFTENFIREFDIITRSGLIESGRCRCECKLKDEFKIKN